MTNIHNHKILILDFGSQYTQLIARRVREIGVYCELWAWDVTEEQIREFNPDGIILSGGPESTTEENSPRAPEYVFNAGVPVLGICYGMQTMAMQLGGLTETSDHREFGYASVLMDNPIVIFTAINYIIYISRIIFYLIKNEIPFCNKHLMIFIYWYICFFKKRKTLRHTA